MLVGHLGAAVLAKHIEPRLSLGTAVLAATAADGLLFAFVLAGFEDVEFRTSTTAAQYFQPLRVALSHSLASAVAVGALAAIAGWRAARRRGAALLLAVAVSHWVFDLITSPSLPVAPFTNVYVAWSLSPWIHASVAVEAVIWFGALVLYVMESRSVTSAGRYVFWGGVVSWTYVAYSNVAGRPRPAADAPIEMLILLVMIGGWAYWMNAARALKTDWEATLPAASSSSA
jgi:hypothetical protein